MSTDTEPTDDDFRWLGFTERQIVWLREYDSRTRRTVYVLELEELMQ